MDAATPPKAGPELRRLLDEEPVRMPHIAALLDALDHAERVAATAGLGREAQRRLWAAAEGFARLGLTDLVPPDVPDEQMVRHIGKNTLPVFSRFEKRFFRPAGEDPAVPTRLYGDNHGATTPLTGPGYYRVTTDTERGELCIDYRQLPDHVPAGWPAVRSNERGVGRLVFGFMVDTLRRVSTHVTIGSAARHGKPLGSWFVLVREG